jgi:spermidine synthase
VLELNEGVALHSYCRAECDAGPAGPQHPSSVLTDNYWDGHLVLGFLASERTPRRVAILGNAAGTTSRALEEFFPATRVDGVEIDSELSEIGRRFFDMNNPRLHLYHEDARPFIRKSDALYDQISLDTYRQPYIPFYLTTREFFESVRDRLRPAGALIVNVGHPEGEEGLEKVLSATLGAVFPHVARDPIEDENTLLVASRVPLSRERLRGAADHLAPALRPVALKAADRIEPPLDGGEVYTDDRAPVEWLIDKSIVDYAANED